jgi:hypothetical protein
MTQGPWPTWISVMNFSTNELKYNTNINTTATTTTTTNNNNNNINNTIN